MNATVITIHSYEHAATGPADLALAFAMPMAAAATRAPELATTPTGSSRAARPARNRRRSAAARRRSAA
ncbi:hypothetical protein [Actinacidiphila soli]|uniref:hypothetical protein n=1 Tax=Actinacidiphila soli TaxID=2487275 RepID=UPI000FCB21AF|nr:hypothetical protein [Actinacidiphila soli]